MQVDYEKFTAKYEDESHGFNPFNYGYIGKFQTKQSPSFEYGTFTKGNRTYEGYIQNGIQDTAVVFTPGDLNLYGTRFTQQYYELLDAQVNADGGYEVSGQNNLDYTTNLNQIRSYNGLVNGDRANLNYNIWYNTGRQYNGYGYTNLGGPNDGGGNNDQYRVRLEGAFDILKPGAPSRNKHSFEFGVEFEQRIQRAYSVSPLGLWDRARGLVNAHILALDTIPTFRINGVDYSYDDPSRPAFFFTDTILFDRAYGNNQAFFDKSLRKSLGLAENGTDFIDLDALTPDQLNLNMFSPDELLQNGASLVSYRGYDPYGNVLTKQPSFNDFFTKRSADGEYERPIAAFRPIYTAAYISDRFYFKDLTFNVGVRIDRFDANQKVLKDEFSLYATKTKAEATEFPSGNSITHPGNIGDNYYVYVDDAKNPTSIKGYRNGSTWYDTYGNELASGEKVVSAKGIQPYLKAPNVLIGDSTFDPNESFTDYKPKVIVMPRLQFQFNLTDRALFFAHYDILSQRPNSRVIMDPTQYLYFGSTGTFNNPNLKPERTIDFEFGFKQTVSKTSAITISAFYREFRDQVQLKKIINAYPNNYLTYANVDFGTTKGFSLDFDMRRTANFSAKVNYTMQFAEGTGSDDRTQLNIVNSNQPNFRSINALNYDARHTFNVSLTYSFADGKEYNGPTVKNKQILSNFGVSVQVAARSGTPYTAQTAATPEAIEGQPGRPISEGSINGTRKPWYFRLNARIWKDFTFVVNKKKEKKDDKRELALQIYLQVQNLIGSKNQVAVYRYTGVPGDDGYLSDPSSFSSIQTALNPQAYKDQYAAAVNSPNNYSTPRRIFLGAIFSF